MPGSLNPLSRLSWRMVKCNQVFEHNMMLETTISKYNLMFYDHNRLHIVRYPTIISTRGYKSLVDNKLNSNNSTDHNSKPNVDSNNIPRVFYKDRLSRQELAFLKSDKFYNDIFEHARKTSASVPLLLILAAKQAGLYSSALGLTEAPLPHLPSILFGTGNSKDTPDIEGHVLSMRWSLGIGNPTDTSKGAKIYDNLPVKDIKGYLVNKGFGWYVTKTIYINLPTETFVDFNTGSLYPLLPDSPIYKDLVRFSGNNLARLADMILKSIDNAMKQHDTPDCPKDIKTLMQEVNSDLFFGSKNSIWKIVYGINNIENQNKLINGYFSYYSAHIGSISSKTVVFYDKSELLDKQSNDKDKVDNHGSIVPFPIPFKRLYMNILDFCTVHEDEKRKVYGGYGNDIEVDHRKFDIKKYKINLSSSLINDSQNLIKNIKDKGIFEKYDGELLKGMTKTKDNQQYSIKDFAAKYYNMLLKEISNDNKELEYTNYLTRIYSEPEDYIVPDRIKSELTGKKYHYKEGSHKSSTKSSFLNLPIHKKYQDIISSINNNPVTIIVGETGSGKTTQVPRYIVENYRLIQDYLKKDIDDLNTSNYAIQNLLQVASNSVAPRVLVTQQRRIAAVSLSHTIAKSMGEHIGQTVGYCIKNDEILPTTSDAQILFTTSGTLLSRISTSLDIAGPTHIIIDEVHEKDTETDLLLSICKKMLARNPNIRIVLMSATANTKSLQKYFDGFGPTGIDGDSSLPPIITVEGRTYEVEERYLDDIMDITKSNENMTFTASSETKNWLQVILDSENGLVLHDNIVPYDLISYSIAHILKSTSSEEAILIFLPGYKEISMMYKAMMLYDEYHFGFNDQKKFNIHILHSNQSLANQKDAISSSKKGVRKIILSTNIAESSLTIPDIVHVIDSGLRRYNIFDISQGCSFLVTRYASKSSLKQRKGRAGRVQPGTYYSLIPRWIAEKEDNTVDLEKLKVDTSNTEMNYELLNADEPSDITQRDITTMMLNLLTARSLGSVIKLFTSTPTPPNVEQIKHGIENIDRYGLFSNDSKLLIKNDNDLSKCISVMGLNKMGKVLVDLHVPPWILTSCIDGSRYGAIDDILKVATLCDDSQMTTQLAEKIDQERTSIFLKRSKLAGDYKYYGSTENILKNNPSYIIPDRDYDIDFFKNNNSETPFYAFIPDASSDLTAALVAFNGYLASYDKDEFCKTYSLSKKYLELAQRNYEILRDRLFVAGRFTGSENLKDMTTIWDNYFENKELINFEKNNEKKRNEIEDYHADSKHIIKFNPTSRHTTGYEKNKDLQDSKINYLSDYSSNFKNSLLDDLKNEPNITYSPWLKEELKDSDVYSNPVNILTGKNREHIIRAIISAKLFPNWAYLLDNSNVNKTYMYRRFDTARRYSGNENLPNIKNVIIASESSLSSDWLNKRGIGPPSFVSYTYLTKENESNDHAVIRNVSKVNPMSLLFFSDLPVVKLINQNKIAILISSKLNNEKLDTKEILNEFKISAEFNARIRKRRNSNQKIKDLDLEDILNDATYRAYVGKTEGSNEEIIIKFTSELEVDMVLELARLCRRHFSFYVEKILEIDEPYINHNLILNELKSKDIAKGFKDYFKPIAITEDGKKIPMEELKENKIKKHDINKSIHSPTMSLDEIEARYLPDNGKKYKKIEYQYKDRINPLIQSISTVPVDKYGIHIIHDELGQISINPNIKEDNEKITEFSESIDNFLSPNSESLNTETQIDKTSNYKLKKSSATSENPEEKPNKDFKIPVKPKFKPNNDLNRKFTIDMEIKLLELIGKLIIESEQFY